MSRPVHLRPRRRRCSKRQNHARARLAAREHGLQSTRREPANKTKKRKKKRSFFRGKRVHQPMPRASDPVLAVQAQESRGNAALRCATQQADRNGVSARWPWQRGAEMDGGRRGLPLRAGDRRLRGEAETLRRGAGTAPAPVGVFHAALRPRTEEPERRGEASVLLLSFICYCRRQATRSRECSGRSLCSPWPGARAVSSSCVSPIEIATARSRWCFAALFSPVLTCLPIWLGPTGQCLFHSSGLDRRRPPAGPSAAWDVCLQKPDQFVAKLCTVVLVHGFSGKTMSRNSNSSAKWTSPFR